MNFASIKQVQAAPLLLLTSILLVFLPHFQYLPFWLSLLALLLLAWRAFHEIKNFRLPGRFLKFILILLALAALIFHFHTILGREAGTAFLLILMSLKLMELKSQRDVYVIIYLGYFMTILGFLYSQSISIALYMLLVVLFLVTTQIAYSHPQTIHKSWLALRSHFTFAFRMLLQAMPIALLLFVLFPRIPGPIWGLPEDAFSAKTGLSNEMSPGRISQLSNNNAVAFRVKFSETTPARHSLYWRGPVFWEYDGYTWSAPRQNINALSFESFNVQALSESIAYTVTLEPHQQNWVFLLDTPAMIPSGTRISLERQILSHKPIKKHMRYEARSFLNYRVDVNVDWKNKNRYLELPAQTAPRTKQFVTQLRETYNKDRQFVQAVLDYFSNEAFYYSRNPPLLFDDPVDEFLFESRKGFCEHYASAFTVMMRQAGIPARVVTGYLGGEMNPLADYMIISQSDAHAWSEVWLEGSGWIRIDPTSIIPVERIENTDDMLRRQTRSAVSQHLKNKPWINRAFRQMRFAFDAANNRWNQWVVGFNQKRQSAIFSAFGIAEIKWKGLATLLAITVSLAIFFLAWQIYRTPGKKLSTEDKTYNQYLKRLQKIGFTKQLYETPWQFSQRIVSARNDLAVPVENITRLYHDLHYGRQKSELVLKDLARQVRLFKPARLGH